MEKDLDWNEEMNEMKSRLADEYKIRDIDGLGGIEGIAMTDYSLEETAKTMGLENPKALFEFFDNFKDDSKILILGSGGNTFTKELEQKFPKLNFTSLDLSYFLVHREGEELFLQHEGKSLTLEKSKQMLSANWEQLPFRKESFDGFFSHYSFPFWGKNFDEGVGDISRVAKQGSKWFFDGHTRDNDFQQILEENNWALESLKTSAEFFGLKYFVGKAVKK